MKISKHTGEYTTGYVCCHKCHKHGKRQKKKIESDLTFYLKSNRYLRAISDLWNGLLYRMPLCCLLYFVRLGLAGVRFNAYTTYLIRDDSYSFDGYVMDLPEGDKEYVYQFLYRYMMDELEEVIWKSV